MFKYVLFSAMTRAGLICEKLENMKGLVRIFLYSLIKMKGLNFQVKNIWNRLSNLPCKARVRSVFQNQSVGQSWKSSCSTLIWFSTLQMAQSYFQWDKFFTITGGKGCLTFFGRLEAVPLNYKAPPPFYCQPRFLWREGNRGKNSSSSTWVSQSSNDVSFTKNIMISGDNVSWKSTYLRTAVNNAILASKPEPLPAESPNSSLMCLVLTAMDVSDSSWRQARCYFIAESQTIKRMLESLEQEGIHYFFSSMSF